MTQIWKCKDCIYFKDESLYRGKCHRHPPLAGIEFDFPCVDKETDFCGEFKRK